MAYQPVTLKEFNLMFLAALDFIDPKLKHQASGTSGKHPNLRLVLLRAVKDDLRTAGLRATIEKYRYFVDPLKKRLFKVMQEKVGFPGGFEINSLDN